MAPLTVGSGILKLIKPEFFFFFFKHNRVTDRKGIFNFQGTPFAKLLGNNYVAYRISLKGL